MFSEYKSSDPVFIKKKYEGKAKHRGKGITREILDILFSNLLLSNFSGAGDGPGAFFRNIFTLLLDLSPFDLNQLFNFAGIFKTKAKNRLLSFKINKLYNLFLFLCTPPSSPTDVVMGKT